MQLAGQMDASPCNLFLPADRYISREIELRIQLHLHLLWSHLAGSGQEAFDVCFWYQACLSLFFLKPGRHAREEADLHSSSHLLFGDLFPRGP